MTAARNLRVLHDIGWSASLMAKWGNVAKTKNKAAASVVLESLPAPTPWPNANARLLGIGAGLPVAPLDRLAQFSASQFERFTLEWATEFLSGKIPDVYEVQQRGGAGDKGRDVVVWHDPPDVRPRRWSLYQCKHYDSRLGISKAAVEIGKVLYYTCIGDYTAPIGYWFVTHMGVTSDLQDTLDDPEKLRKYMKENWVKHCATDITSTKTIDLTPELSAHIDNFDFSIFKAKQPLDLINEHAETRYHLAVFGLPLIERGPPKAPPSTVAPSETEYVGQLYEVIGHEIGMNVKCFEDFSHISQHKKLFDRSRIMFYCAEGLKELARDQMADPAYFDTLLDEFQDGLFFDYTSVGQTGMQRLLATIKAAQALQLTGHVLGPHVRAKDREGMCHQMANEKRLRWCE